MVLQGRNVAGTFDVAPNELTGSRLIEAAPAPVEDTGVADQVLDHRLGVRPINLGGRHEAPKLLCRRWQPTVAGRRRRGTDQDKREHAIGEVNREQLCEGPAGRDTDDVSGLETIGVEHAGGIGDQVSAVVRGVARLIRHRSAGVAVVVADHEPPSASEHPAKPLVPPEHRPANTHDEKDRRVGWVPERLRAQRHAVGFDHPLGHVASSLANPRPSDGDVPYVVDDADTRNSPLGARTPNCRRSRADPAAGSAALHQPRVRRSRQGRTSPDGDQLDGRHDSSPFSWEIHHPPSRRTAHDVPIGVLGLLPPHALRSARSVPFGRDVAYRAVIRSAWPFGRFTIAGVQEWT